MRDLRRVLGGPAAAVILVNLALAGPAAAIVGRHDTPAEAYIVPASDYPQVAQVMGQVEGTLIADRWVLTAAHAVESRSPFLLWRAELGGRSYAVDKIVIHPKRVNGAVDSDYDVALVRLTEPVAGIAPAGLYEASDEAGQEVVLVGRGVAGTGDMAVDARSRDGRMRRASNRVEATFEHSLTFTFDAPPGGTRFEGVAGDGDSGGPAFIVKDGVPLLAGVGSFNSGESTYGTLEGYARVSAHLTWIRGVIADDPPSTLTAWEPFVPARAPRDLPHTRPGEAVRAFLAALKIGRRQDFADFYTRYGAPSTRTLDVRIQDLTDFRTQHGGFDLAGYRAQGDRSLAFIMHSRKTGSWQGGLFEVGPDGERLTSFNLGRLSPDVLAQFGLGEP